MELVFACEGHFVKNAQGKYYSVNGGFTNLLWNRYLSVFSHILVIARVKVEAAYHAKEALRADNEQVSFVELPDYVGPVQYLKVKSRIKHLIKTEIVPGRAYLCRLPGIIGGEVISVLKRREISYACEVVGDPWEVFGPDGVRHPLRIVLRHRGRRSLRRQVAAASSVLYVTKQSLQNRYPCSEGVFSTDVSDVLLLKENIASYAKKLENKGEYRLISVGSLGQMYKSPDVVIRALAILKKQGIRCHLSWLGDGKYKEEMKGLAESLGVADEICFCGNVPAAEVVRHLRESDIFLLVSKTEGLPRAMVEAMAQGLPCIGSNVGGSPELFHSSAIVPKGDTEALADKIMYMITHVDYTNQQAERNLAESFKYENSLLDERRVRFYNNIVNQVIMQK